MRTVLACDTEPIVMEGLRALLESTNELRLVAAESSIVDSMVAVRDLSPSLVVLDRAFGTRVIIDWLNALHRGPSAPAVVIFGTSVSESEALRLLHAGAAGVLRKTSPLDSILRCIRTVAAGGTWVEDDLLRQAGRPGQRAHSPLTARESQVLERVRQGLTNREIALELEISVGTVKIHLKHIFEKTGLHGRHALEVSRPEDLDPPRG